MVLDKILKEYCENPNLTKPLKICHGFAYNSSMTIQQKMNIISVKLKEYAGLGYGGIVTNVSFNNYLNDDEEWQLFRFTLQSCREMSLRVWLYDEKAYPSGSAGGLTLAEHPEYQAQAIALKTITTCPGEKIEICFPKNHSFVEAAFSYQSDSPETITYSDVMNPYKIYPLKGTQNSISEINKSGRKITTVYFIRKNMYEGTHAIHNVAESRRYIDVSNKDAVRAFIDNTYKKYAHYIKDCGKIEAIFTDEPSYMGAYINAGHFPPSIHDEYDENMEFLPVVNWGADVENRFMSKFGYDIMSRLIYLFTGKSKHAKQTRLDFYELMSELYEESFFAQISDYCSQINISFSGHVLLEDDIRYHPVFEGNMFSLLRHMHIPGIDMLNGTPERTRADAFTPKLVSSIAHAYNRTHVMSEVSAHAQDGKVSHAQMLGTVTAQYALGVNVFTSYFSDNALPAEQYQEWNDTIGRIDKIMGGGKHITNIAVYYPIETIQANYIPFGEQISHELDRIPENKACWNSLRNIYDTLLNNQLDFDFLDSYCLSRAEISDTKFITAGGEKFKVLIVPACYVTEKIEMILRRFHHAGIKVIVLHDESFNHEIDKMRECGAVITEDISLMTGMIKEYIDPDILLNAYTPELIYLFRENDHGKSILTVNTSDKSIHVRAAIKRITGNVILYDPQLNVTVGNANASAIDMDLGPYKSLMILQGE